MPRTMTEISANGRRSRGEMMGFAKGSTHPTGYNDTVRAENALNGIVGKRLMYRRPDESKIS
jgi:hypothetical protein